MSCVDGATRIGAGTKVLPFASIGTPPQDLKYRNEPTRCEVGPKCLIREGVTIHRASVGGGGVTKVGAGCMLMAQAHVAHDCILGEGVILANNVMLGGHVLVGDGAFIGGGAAVHQTVRIGRLAMVSGLAGVPTTSRPSAMSSACRHGSSVSTRSACCAAAPRATNCAPSGSPTTCCSRTPANSPPRSSRPRPAGRTKPWCRRSSPSCAT